MNVTTKITVDLTRPNMGTRVNAVQGDGNTRIVEVSLLSGGEAWEPPADAEAAIAYYQPGGAKGLYNLLADGTAAISISGNVATIILAPQMLTASGTVQASLVFNDASLNRLTTFPFAVSVASNPAAGAQKVEDYLRLQWLEDKLDEYMRKAADSGEFNGAPGEDGKDYDHSAEFSALAAQMAGYQQQVEQDRQAIADAAAGVSGAVQEAGEAALDAMASAEAAAQSAEASRQAAEILQPEVDQIKNYISENGINSPYVIKGDK